MLPFIWGVRVLEVSLHHWVAKDRNRSLVVLRHFCPELGKRGTSLLHRGIHFRIVPHDSNHLGSAFRWFVRHQFRFLLAAKTPHGGCNDEQSPRDPNDPSPDLAALKNSMD